MTNELTPERLEEIRAEANREFALCIPSIYVRQILALLASHDALTRRCEGLRLALGFDNDHDDAALNLEGALDDLTNTNGNDEVTRATIKRVLDQLYEARAALSPGETNE